MHAGEGRERNFKLVMRLSVAAHQMRRPSTCAILRGALLHRGDETRVIGQTEVIVAAERQILFAVYQDMRRLRALQHASLAQQTLRGALVESTL